MPPEADEPDPSPPPPPPPAYQPDLAFDDSAPPPGSTTDSFQARVEFSEVFIGPLPSPRTLAEYEAVHPGLAERIIAGWETQGAHRQSLELTVVQSDAFAQRVGAVSGPVIALAGLGIGAWLIYEGRDPQGFAVIVTALGSLLTAFLYGKRAQRKELDEKQAQSTLPPGPPQLTMRGQRAHGSVGDDKDPGTEPK